MAKTVKELNVVINDLQQKFQTELSQFKKSLKDASSPEPLFNGMPYEDLIKRFAAFETKMMQQVSELKDAVVKLSERDEQIENRIDRQEQNTYGRKLLIHGIEEKDRESSEELFQIIEKLLREKLNVNIDKKYVSDWYRKGRRQADKNRPVVISFAIKWLRDEVFMNKSKFKGSGVVCTELLTYTRYDIFKKCAALYGKQCWTVNGVIVVLKNGERKYVSTIKQYKELVAIVP